MFGVHRTQIPHDPRSLNREMRPDATSWSNGDVSDDSGSPADPLKRSDCDIEVFSGVGRHNAQPQTLTVFLDRRKFDRIQKDACSVELPANLTNIHLHRNSNRNNRSLAEGFEIKCAQACLQVGGIFLQADDPLRLALDDFHPAEHPRHGRNRQVGENMYEREQNLR